MRSSLDRNIAGVGDASDRRRPHRSLAIARGRDLAGVIEHGARVRGHPETWEVSSFSPRTRGGQPAEQVQAQRRVRDVASEQTHRW
jgi:hypothetical protein